MNPHSDKLPLSYRCLKQSPLTFVYMTPPAQLTIPARMMNEYVYCPRLFYLEFVDGVFMHNSDTLRGAAAHKRVDRKRDGKLPQSDNEFQDPEGIIHSRSVSLFSERLGITAKLDLVESQLDCGDIIVVPVEYKKGKPRESDDGPEIWEADQMQLGLQMLLLEENGYRCPEGILYYRETKQRVSFVLTDDKISWIERMIEKARQCCFGSIPPPLENSPKCPRCSLLPICLPDESQALSHTSNEKSGIQQMEWEFTTSSQVSPTTSWTNPVAEIPLPDPPAIKEVRRLIAPNPETRALYLNTPGQYISKSGDVLVMKEEGTKVAEVRLSDLNHVAVFGPVQLSTPAIHSLCEEDIPISWFSTGGWFYGITHGHSQKNVFTRIEQFRVAADRTLSLFLARQFIYGKVRNQRTLLMRNHRSPDRMILKQLKVLAHAALGVPSLDSLLGLEGSAAMLFFGQFSGMFKNRHHQTQSDWDSPLFDEENEDMGDSTEAPLAFTFDSRNRRPPRDPVNALLSLTYSLLAKDCTLACHIVGMDPYVGFLHQPRFGRPALALDLMEEFRPLVADSVVLSLINTRIITIKDFITSGHGVNLTPQGRKRVFMAYERRMNEAVTHPVFQYRVGYRRAIELQARLLAKFLTGEVESYYPFITR